MNEIFFSAIGIFALGLTTTLHPCPFTTNIAAISLLSGSCSRRGGFSIAVFGFTTGYMLAYLFLAILLSQGAVAIPALSIFLQRVLSSFLGPLLIVVGMVLTKLIDLRGIYKVISLNKNLRLTNGSFFSSLLLGSILALTFCPASASVFFGILIPVSVKSESTFLFPVIYAVGAVVPVAVLSILIQKGLFVFVGKHWATKVPGIAGWILILLGIYITLADLYF